MKHKCPKCGQVVRTPKGILILAHELAGAALKRYGFESAEVVGQCSGSALELLQLQHLLQLILVQALQQQYQLTCHHCLLLPALHCLLC